MLSAINGEFTLWTTPDRPNVFQITSPSEWSGRKSKEEILAYLYQMESFAAAAAQAIIANDEAQGVMTF
jgi:hypothetical protein